MIYVLISPLIYRIVKSNIISILCCASLLILYSTGFLEIPNISSSTVASGIYPDMLLYFLLGSLIGHNKYIMKNKNNTIPLILLCVSVAIWVLNRNGYKEWKYYIGNAAFIILAIMSIFSWIPTYNTGLMQKVIEKIRPHTFIIFALHPFVVEVFQKLFYILMPHNGIGALVDYVFSPVLTVISCVLFSTILKKIWPRFYGVIVGGRV